MVQGPGRDEARIRHRARLLEEANVRQLAVRAEQRAQRRLRARAVANVGNMQLCAGGVDVFEVTAAWRGVAARNTKRSL